MCVCVCVCVSVCVCLCVLAYVKSLEKYLALKIVYIRVGCCYHYGHFISHCL